MLTVVTGPPCGGKSTYIRTNSQPGDIIIDLDRIALALAHDTTEHHNYGQAVRHVAMAARRGAVQAALNVAHQVNVWIIDTNPTRQSWSMYRQAHAVIVKQDPGIDVVMARAAAERPAWVMQFIEDYYARRERP